MFVSLKWSVAVTVGPAPASAWCPTPSVPQHWCPSQESGGQHSPVSDTSTPGEPLLQPPTHGSYTLSTPCSTHTLHNNINTETVPGDDVIEIMVMM